MSSVLEKHFDGVVEQIETEVGLKSCFEDDEIFRNYDAVWDTGAMTSCISLKVVKELNLSPVGMIEVQAVGGAPVRCPVYLMDFRLSNGLVIGVVKTVGTDIAGADVIIGMDIISQGDFAIFHDEQGDMNMSFVI